VADRLLLLIPGYQFVFQKNATLDLLKEEIADLADAMQRYVGLAR
jgi:hypothetical protein